MRTVFTILSFLLLLVACKRSGPPTEVLAKFAALDAPKEMIDAFNQRVRDLEFSTGEVPVLSGPVFRAESREVLDYLEGQSPEIPAFSLHLEVQSEADFKIAASVLSVLFGEFDYEQVSIMVCFSKKEQQFEFPEGTTRSHRGENAIEFWVLDAEGNLEKGELNIPMEPVAPAKKKPVKVPKTRI